jgi:hypothetical protein
VWVVHRWSLRKTGELEMRGSPVSTRRQAPLGGGGPRQSSTVSHGSPSLGPPLHVDAMPDCDAPIWS